MNKIALLGSGYIGKNLIGSLKAKGFYLRMTTTTEEKIADLSTIADEVMLLSGNDLDGIRHLLFGCESLIITVAPKRSSDYQTVYLDTARTICQLQPKLKRLIYTSSTSIYGDQNGNWVDEQTPANPGSKEGDILLQTERMYLNLSQETKVCILRLGGIYGPERNFVERIKRLSEQSMLGNGQNFTNFVHRDDAVSAIVWSLENDLTGIYNVVNDTHMRRKDLYSALRNLHPLPEVVWDRKRADPHSGNKRVSNAKLKNTGFLFAHPEFSYYPK